MKNTIMTIVPYKHYGTWVFDDPATGLVKEAFVAGADEFIDDALAAAGSPEATRCKILFSAQPFPGFNLRLDKSRSELAGTWYKDAASGKEGWLCSALFLYFETAPSTIFAQITPLLEEE